MGNAEVINAAHLGNQLGSSRVGTAEREKESLGNKNQERLRRGETLRIFITGASGLSVDSILRRGRVQKPPCVPREVSYRGPSVEMEKCDLHKQCV